jgi:hypothetical protein
VAWGNWKAVAREEPEDLPNIATITGCVTRNSAGSPQGLNHLLHFDPPEVDPQVSWTLLTSAYSFSYEGRKAEHGKTNECVSSRQAESH